MSRIMNPLIVLVAFGLAGLAAWCDTSGFAPIPPQRLLGIRVGYRPGTLKASCKSNVRLACTLTVRAYRCSGHYFCRSL